MVTWGPTMNRQTHTTENITFPQLRWQMVKIFYNRYIYLNTIPKSTNFIIDTVPDLTI